MMDFEADLVRFLLIYSKDMGASSPWGLGKNESEFQIPKKRQSTVIQRNFALYPETDSVGLEVLHICNSRRELNFVPHEIPPEVAKTLNALCPNGHTLKNKNLSHTSVRKILSSKWNSFTQGNFPFRWEQKCCKTDFRNGGLIKSYFRSFQNDRFQD